MASKVMYYKKLKNKNYLTPTVIGGVLIILLTLTLWVTIRDSKKFVDKLIADDIEKLDSIFTKINESAQILNFEQEKNHIDFLNVEKFVGSQIGAMNLAYPDKWKGPYLNANPTIQQRFFQILKNKNGFYIIPGDGVKLANGKIIGKDIILNKDSDIDQMIKNKQSLLSYYNKPLAKKINLKKEFSENEKKGEELIEDNSEEY